MEPTGKQQFPVCRGMKCDGGMKCVMAEQCQYKSSAEEAAERIREQCGAFVDDGCVEVPPLRIQRSDTILDEAKRLTGNGGDRNDSYDHPYPNFSRIAEVWTTLLDAKLKPDTSVTPRDVALLMIGMKIVRDAHKGRRDNLVDIAGYARCIERLEEWETDDGEE